MEEIAEKFEKAMKKGFIRILTLLVLDKVFLDKSIGLDQNHYSFVKFLKFYNYLTDTIEKQI